MISPAVMWTQVHHLDFVANFFDFDQKSKEFFAFFRLPIFSYWLDQGRLAPTGLHAEYYLIDFLDISQS